MAELYMLLCSSFSILNDYLLLLIELLLFLEGILAPPKDMGTSVDSLSFFKSLKVIRLEGSLLFRGKGERCFPAISSLEVTASVLAFRVDLQTLVVHEEVEFVFSVEVGCSGQRHHILKLFAFALALTLVMASRSYTLVSCRKLRLSLKGFDIVAEITF